MLGRGAFSCARRGAFSCAREGGFFHVLGRGAFFMC